MKSGYFVKNADEMQKLDNLPQEEAILKEVAKEIKALGDDQKTNYDKMNHNYEELKSTINSLDGKYVSADHLEKIQKLTTDIAVRQDEMDKGIHKRVDDIEVSLKRVGGSGRVEDSINMKEVQDFYVAAGTVKSRDKGLNIDDVEAVKEKASPEEFKAYQKNFNRFIRRNNSPNNLNPDEIKALSVGVDPDGGYTVTPVMNNTIITKLYESDPLRELVAVESISTGAIEWMVDWGQAGYGWEEETVAGSETDTPQLYKKRIPVHIMYAKPRASQVLLEDSGINIETWLANKVADRFMRVESAAFVTGDGVGKPRGFLTYSSGTTYGTVEQVAMGATAALTADGFISVKYSLIEYYLNRGTWLMSRGTVAATMKLKNGEGDYIWKPGLTSDTQSTILGLPVRMSTTMPSVAADALSVALGDWKQAYMIVDRLGITIQRDPYTQKPMIEFYTRKRVGGDVVNGQALKIGKVSAS